MAAVDDLFTCAICLDLFKSPRRLPCHHVYCLQCLRDHVNNITYRRAHIKCPECRRHHVVPNNRVEEFPVDSRLEQLIEKMAKLRPASDDDCRDISALSKCEHSQPTCTCRECRSNRALLLETILQDSRQFRADFFTTIQSLTRQKQKVQLLGHIENLHHLRMKVVIEIDDIIKELEKRKSTLLSRIEKEEKLIVEDISKLDQADTISAENESLSTNLVEKVHPTETLVSMKGRLSKQKELMTSLQNVGQSARLLGVEFNRDELRKMIDSYGEFCTVDYQKDFTIATTLDGSESGGLFKRPWGLTVCPFTDNVYVTDYTSVRVYNSDDMGNNRIQVFTPNGTFLSVIGGGILRSPRCLQINKRQEILVTDCNLGQVVIFDKDGTHLKTISGEGDNKLNAPWGICLDDRNRILVADYSSKKIQVYNDDGTHHSTISQPAAAMTSMNGLAVTNNGDILIPDWHDNKIHLIRSLIIRTT